MSGSRERCVEGQFLTATEIARRQPRRHLLYAPGDLNMRRAAAAPTTAP